MRGASTFNREDSALSEKLKRVIGGRVWKLVFTALLLCGSLARNSEAGISCDDPQTKTTSTRAGFGVDCAAARSDLESDTRAEANSVCQSLGYDLSCIDSLVIITKKCAWNENHLAYKVAGYREFRCAYWIPPVE